jgi:tRNA threonylcarbamoyladenosine biosynthesis protein TsaB
MSRLQTPCFDVFDANRLLAADYWLGNPGRMDGAKRILAIETSGRHGSVALLSCVSDRAEVLKQIELSGNERTAQILAPSIRGLLNEKNWSPKSVDLVAVAVGPGSFTGLRIGVTTAKTFAYAAKTQLLGINTLEAIAAQAPAADGRLWAMLDAQRQELFAASFARSESGLTTVRETHIISVASWLAGLQPGDRVSGPALSRIAKSMPANVNVVPQDLWQPMATSVGQLAWKKFQTGQTADIWQLVPQYYRSSAAEEKAKNASLR